MTSLDVRVSSWAELDELLHTDINATTAGRYHPHLAYRGVASAAWPTMTSLQRLDGPFEILEHHILRDFHKYSHPTVPASASIWEVLAIGQHFGLPTRLLDWTYSPMVALHFATWDTAHFDVDAAIWMVDYRALHQRLPSSLVDAFDSEVGDSFSVHNLARAVPTLADFERLGGPGAMLMFEPPSLDARIVNQYAAFGVTSVPGADPAALLEGHGSDVARRIVVPSGMKPEIRDRLDQDNITERMLLPGLDGLSKWLRRYYSPTAGLSRRS